MQGNTNFDERPFIAIWETTQACDLTCVYCRASAQPSRNPGELSTAEGKRLIDEIAAMEVPVFVLTGGDPLKRPDIFELVRYAASQNVRVSLTSSPTSLLARDSIVRLKECGLVRLAVSLDGPGARIHDAFRGLPGSFHGTLDAVRWAQEIGLPVQINTTVTRHNLELLDDIIDLLDTINILSWNVFFPSACIGADRPLIYCRRWNSSRPLRSCITPRSGCFSISRPIKRSIIAAIFSSGAVSHGDWDNGTRQPMGAFRSFHE